MTEISERYRRLSDQFAATIAAVPDDRWDSPSPCEEWDARGVVRHIVDAHGTFEGLVDRAPRPGPSVDDDPAGAFAVASGQMLAELEDPALADVEFDGFFGPSAFGPAVDRFVCNDLLVHRWDLARATGGDEAMPIDEVERGLVGLQALGDVVRGNGVFGPAVEPPPGADAQTRFLCFTGRHP